MEHPQSTKEESIGTRQNVVNGHPQGRGESYHVPSPFNKNIQESEEQLVPVDAYQGPLDFTKELAELNKSELGQLHEAAKTEIYDEGEVVLKEGEIGDYFYFLRDGSASAFLETKDGPWPIVQYAHPGDYMSDFLQMNEKGELKKRALVIADKCGCSILRIPRCAFLRGPFIGSIALNIINTMLAQNKDMSRWEYDMREMEEDREKRKIMERWAPSRSSRGNNNGRRRKGIYTGIGSEGLNSTLRDLGSDWEPPVYEKEELVRQELRNIIIDKEGGSPLNVLLGHLREADIFTVIDAMSPVHVDAGETVMWRGQWTGDDDSNRCFVVERGCFDILRQNSNDDDHMDDEQLATVSVNEVVGKGAVFGELALLYDAPREATVTAREPSKLWALGQETLKKILRKVEDMNLSNSSCPTEDLLSVTNHNNTVHYAYDSLSTCDVLKSLTRAQMCKLCDVITTDVFDGGEILFQRGDEATIFYIVDEGEISLLTSSNDDGDGDGGVKIKRCRVGECMGKRALLSRECKRTARAEVVAPGASVLQVGKEDFFEFIARPLGWS